MPPKKAQPKVPAIPLTAIHNVALSVDISELHRHNPVLQLLQKSFREAAALNEDARELIHDVFAVKPPATPKKKRDKLNQVIQKIDDFVAPVRLNFDELDDGQEMLEVKSSVATSPVKAAPSTPKPTFFASKPTPKAKDPPEPPPVQSVLPAKKGKVPQVVKPFVSKIPKPPTVVRKPLKTTEQNVNDELINAEERKKQHLFEKAERIRLEREEKDAKARERREQLAEEKKRVADGFRNQYARLKEFEETNKVLFSPRTPIREPPKIKDKLTPRRIQVPVKKGRDMIAVEDVHVVASPKLKRKIAGKSKQVAETLESVSDSLAMRQEQDEPMSIAVEAAGDAMDVEELHYEEVTPDEVNHYSNAFRTPSISMNSFEQHEATIQHESAKECISEDLFATTPTIILSQPDPVNVCEEREADPVSNYDMTAEKIFLPSSADNYNLEDLSSADETDDETKPRKEIPRWAKHNQLRPAVIAMEKKYTLEERAALFGVIHQPSVESFFGSHRNTRIRRSSVNWNSPFAKPTPGFSRLPY